MGQGVQEEQDAGPRRQAPGGLRREVREDRVPPGAARVGGLVEVVGDDAGLLVDRDDDAALAAAISRLARDPAAARALADAGRARVASRFTLAAMARETRAVYRRLVSPSVATA